MASKHKRHIGFDSAVSDLPPQFLSAIRELLCRGLDPKVAKACFRIRENRPLAGGFKADLVNGVALDFNIVLKKHDYEELALHALLMKTVNRVVTKPRTFPLILDLVNLKDGDGLLIMEHLTFHKSLHEAVFLGKLSQRALPQICRKISEALLRVQKAGQRKRSTLKGIASHRRAIFVDRIREKLEDVFKDEPDLQVVLRNSGTVMGETCAPINEILQKAERFLEGTRTRVTPVLQHGDPHLGNIMIRRYRFGHGVKLLDPNPLIGFHDPLYDVGKLFHWAEEVGWAAIRPELCVGKLVRRGSHWQLTSNNVRTSRSDRLRRKLVEIVDTQIFGQLVPESDGTARDRLPLAIASAHIGLTTPLTGADKRDVRRFVLAHALRHLALWNKAN